MRCKTFPIFSMVSKNNNCQYFTSIFGQKLNVGKNDILFNKCYFNAKFTPKIPFIVTEISKGKTKLTIRENN